jgi:streptogramin lyase
MYAMPAPYGGSCTISALAAATNGSVYVLSRNNGNAPFCGDIPGSILKVDPAGNFTRAALNDPTRGRNIFAATSDAAGMLYFAGRICCDAGPPKFYASRLNADDTVTDVLLPQTPRQPGATADASFDVDDVIVGPDGKLWYLRQAAGTIGRVDISSAAVTEYTPPTVNSGPYFAAVGSDGNLWFSENSNHAVARVRFVNGLPSGVITEYQLPNPYVPWVMTAHTDGTLWVLVDIQKVVRIDPMLAPVLTR